jgi:hypothetical protein
MATASGSRAFAAAAAAAAAVALDERFALKSGVVRRLRVSELVGFNVRA